MLLLNLTGFNFSGSGSTKKSLELKFPGGSEVLPTIYGFQAFGPFGRFRASNLEDHLRL